MPIPQLTETQIQSARDIDLLSYLQTHAPHSIRKSGANEYCLVEHDSFKISNGFFNWFSRGVGGRGALDYLIKVEGMKFVDAVQHLTGVGVSPVTFINPAALPRASPPKPKRPLVLPERNRNNDRAYAYLRGRGIGKDLINRCIAGGLLYESAKAHRCVFVGKDGDGVAKFACERGTRDDWKKDVAGSDKRFSFHLPPSSDFGHKNLAVFESAIDVLAHHEIHRLEQSGKDGYRLSLGGTSPLALTGFLERNPQIRNVALCLDNDEAGINATAKIIEALGNNKHQVKITARPPPYGKDYADSLMAIRQQHNIQPPTRQHAGIAI